MKTLDDVVVELNGVWVFGDYDYVTQYNDESDWEAAKFPAGVVRFDRCWFERRAKELGFVKWYRWGVEYATNGNKPDLADDVVVCIESGAMQNSVDGWDWPLIESFRITDPRYKPEDTSYLDKPDSSIDNDSDWYCYETQKALRLPPVGAVCLVWFDDGKECWQKCKVLAMSPYEHDHMAVSLIGCYDRKLVWSQDFKPLDHATRAKELEKKQVVDAAAKKFHSSIMPDYSGQPFLDGLGALYDAGFLKLPEDI
jgi:hypothetical protein